MGGICLLNAVGKLYGRLQIKKVCDSTDCVVVVQ